MPSQRTLIQKGKERIFLFIKSQTRPNPTFPSVGTFQSVLWKGCYSPAHWPRPDSAALGERKRPNQTNKKIYSYSEVSPATCTQQPQQSQDGQGETRAMCGTSSHSTECTAPGRLRHRQLPLSLCPSSSLELVLPGAPSRSEGHREQSTCHVLARLCQAKGNKGR